jgi:hypothetical protein
LTRRYALLTRANNDPAFRALVLAHAAEDVVDWVRDWVWTYDPRVTPSIIPFDLFPRQVEFLRWLGEGDAIQEGGLAEKSRDMGVTWLCVAYAVHCWLFKTGDKTTFGSRKEALVDKLGDPDSIFEKIRLVISRLPSWMMPAGYGKTCDNHLRIVNPANGSSITGEGGDNMGRGGRSSRYFKDESAFLERPQRVEAAVSANTNVVIDVSTPNGVGNPFHTKRMSGAVRVFTFHWRDDPRKGTDWYERQKAVLDPIIVAQELDIDYAASIEGILIPRGWIEDAWARPLHEKERGAISIGGDVAEAGRDKSSAVIREGRRILHLEEWHDPDATLSASKFIGLGLQFEKRLGQGHKLYFFIDAIGVGSGVVGDLRLYAREKKKTDWVVIGVKSSKGSPEDKCHRLRDALWWRMRRWFDRELPTIVGDYATGAGRQLRDKLTNELSSVTYRPNSSGLIEIESKDSLKKRGIASPNLADALMHTFDLEAIKPAEEEGVRWLLHARAGGGRTGMVV